MIDPTRLLDDGGDPFERALLGSARRDHGSLAAQTRCIAAATAATVVVTHATATAATAVAAATAAKAATATSIGAGLIVKAVAIGFAVGLGVQGVVAVSNHVNRDPSTQPHKPPAVTSNHSKGSPTPMAVVTSPVEPEAIPSVAPQRALAPSAAARVVASSGAAGEQPSSEPRLKVLDEPQTDLPISVTRDDSLEREVAVLDEARRFVLAHGYDRTLLLLDRYQRDFPAGALGPEALVLRVQALLGLRRRAEAEALAKRFMALHPSSPISKRLNALLGNGQ